MMSRLLQSSFPVLIPLAVVALARAAEPSSSKPSPAVEPYPAVVMADKPVAYWRFDGRDALRSQAGPGAAALRAKVVGGVQVDVAGPRPPQYPAFTSDNQAARFGGGRGFLRAADPGENSLLDFDNGDSITLEAWVNLAALSNNQQVYIVGKGRTLSPGQPAENQNYALRLRGEEGQAKISFLFRSAAAKGHKSEYHRWNSTLGFLPGDGWRHVAVTYTFGKADSIRGYLDGQPVKGRWDMAGPTAAAPVVDNDQLWIGSSLGGKQGSTFQGEIDEVAIYRRALPPESFGKRFTARRVELAETPAEPPPGEVLVEVFERVHPTAPLARLHGAPATSYTLPVMAVVGLPQKYTAEGVIADRPGAYVVRASTVRRLTAGEYQIMLRARSAAKLLVDGRTVLATPPMKRNASGHESVPELAAAQHEGTWPVAPGDQEKLVTVQLPAGEHKFVLAAQIGGKGLRAETGELCVAICRKGEPLSLLTPARQPLHPLTHAGWRTFRDDNERRLAEINAATRRQVAAAEDQYWRRRHELARREIESRPAVEPPPATDGYRQHNAIDRFINAGLAKVGLEQTPPTDDYEFLRRLSLDTVGVGPSPEEIKAFLNDRPERRRAKAIDRYLADPRWADHWVGYWQDVLAENPGILKPKLNNTGPFRWWIHESFIDNKPMDRFVTELVMMRGSRYGGGPAGFSLATQNDVPMAAKAHVIGKAFLAAEMKCARCHDAPYHPFKQRQLFEMAAMLQRQPITLPKTSTVPVGGGSHKPQVEITIKPGEKLAPKWSLTELSPAEPPPSVLRNPNDPREKLAALLTSPKNDRFARVVVNRLWARYLGRGIVAPVDDWADSKNSHPELLDYLARDFVVHGYDLKRTARLIFNSHAYQRRPVADGEKATVARRQFAGPTRRRLTAEQIVDSLFTLAGKSMDAEMLTLDPEGRRPETTFLNLGRPSRAWHFTSLSNERDRPALALPMAQTVIDLLTAYGWRDSRPAPITEREEAATVLQPLTLANGVASRRIARLSEDSAFTELALREQPVEKLVEQVFLRVLGRPPRPEESAAYVELLSPGYDSRRTGKPAREEIVPKQRNAVSWSNHLSAEATRIKLELERAVLAGDPPTERLTDDWRRRLEDGVWALLNSPEFVFSP